MTYHSEILNSCFPTSPDNSSEAAKTGRVPAEPYHSPDQEIGMKYLRVNAPDDSQGQFSVEETANPKAMAGYSKVRRKHYDCSDKRKLRGQMGRYRIINQPMCMRWPT